MSGCRTAATAICARSARSIAAPPESGLGVPESAPGGRQIAFHSGNSLHHRLSEVGPREVFDVDGADDNVLHMVIAEVRSTVFCILEVFPARAGPLWRDFPRYLSWFLPGVPELVHGLHVDPVRRGRVVGLDGRRRRRPDAGLRASRRDRVVPNPGGLSRRDHATSIHLQALKEVDLALDAAPSHRAFLREAKLLNIRC